MDPTGRESSHRLASLLNKGRRSSMCSLRLQDSLHRLASNGSRADSQTGTLRPAPSLPAGPADRDWLGEQGEQPAEAQQRPRQRESMDLVFAARRVPPPPGQRLSIDSALERVKMHQTLTVRTRSEHKVSARIPSLLRRVV